MNRQYHWLSGTCHRSVHSLFIWTYFTFESISSFKSDFAATRNIGTFPLCSFSSGIQRSRTFIKEYWWSYEHKRINSVADSNILIAFFDFVLRFWIVFKMFFKIEICLHFERFWEKKLQKMVYDIEFCRYLEKGRYPRTVGSPTDCPWIPY